jgi:micrococcal nuclease
MKALLVVRVVALLYWTRSLWCAAFVPQSSFSHSSSLDILRARRGNIQQSNQYPESRLHAMPSKSPVLSSSVSSIVSLVSQAWNLCLAALLSGVRLISTDIHTSRQWTWMALALATGYGLGRLPPFWQRYTRVIDVPRSRYSPKTLWGKAVSVSDGDTLRFLHVPTPLHPRALRKGEKASELALPIRICTIDTPETAKFGKSGQPFGVEAKEALQGLVSSARRIGIKVLQTDQYSRAVAQVLVPRGWFRRPIQVDKYMLEKGLAEVYVGGGAVYGPLGLDGYLEMQEEAKRKKLGIWSKGKRESAAEYKRRTK